MLYDRPKDSRSRRIAIKACDAFRQVDPVMPPSVVDRHGRGWKCRIPKPANRDADPIIDTVFGMEQVAAADRAEAEHEARTVIADAPVFGCVARHLIRRSEARERGKNAAGALLAGVTVADANTERFTVDLDAKLAAAAGCGSRGHGGACSSGFAEIEPIDSRQASQAAAAMS